MLIGTSWVAGPAVGCRHGPKTGLHPRRCHLVMSVTWNSGVPLRGQRLRVNQPKHLEPGEAPGWQRWPLSQPRAPEARCPPRGSVSCVGWLLPRPASSRDLSLVFWAGPSFLGHDLYLFLGFLFCWSTFEVIAFKRVHWR